MTEAEPGEAFQALTREEVQAALDTDNPANPIALEVYRLVDAYAREHAQAAQRLGYIPGHLLTMKPQSAVEAIALRLILAALQKKLARR